MPAEQTRLHPDRKKRGCRMQSAAKYSCFKRFFMLYPAYALLRAAPLLFFTVNIQSPFVPSPLSVRPQALQ